MTVSLVNTISHNVDQSINTEILNFIMSGLNSNPPVILVWLIMRK